MENDKKDPIKDYLKNLIPEHDSPDDLNAKIKIKVGGDYVRGDQYHEVNHIHATSSRLLNKDEQRTLNNLVKELTEDFGESRQQTWASINRILGIDSIETMHLDHYKPTEAILQLLLENAALRRTPGGADNDAALRFLLSQSDTALQTQTNRNTELTTQLKIARQVNTRLESQINQQTNDLRNSMIKRQRALNELKQLFSPCPQCKIARTSMATERKRLVASVIVACLASVSAIFCAHQAQASAVQAKEADARSKLCQFEGKHYSIGSVMNSQNLSHVECVSQEKNLAPIWLAMAKKG